MIKVLRWIAVFPTALAIMGILFYVFQIIHYFLPAYRQVPWLGYFMLAFVSHLVAVWGGVLMAPRHRKITTIILCILLILLNAVLLIGNLMHEEYYRIIEVVGSVVGVVFGGFIFYSNIASGDIANHDI